MTLKMSSLPRDARGVIPSQLLAEAVELGFIDAGDHKFPGCDSAGEPEPFV